MDPTERALLYAILDDPDDDAVRLVYADWLEDNGDPARAEFIRVQIELARMDEFDLSRAGLQKREQELLGEHRHAWVAPFLPWSDCLGGAGGLAEFRRGFLEEIDLSVETFVTRGEALFQVAPIRHALLSSVSDKPTSAAASPMTMRMEMVVEPADDAVRELARCPHLGRLHGLSFDLMGLTDDGVRALAASEYLSQLRALTFRYGAGLGPSGVEAVLSSSRLPRLGSLTVVDVELFDCDAQRLLASWSLPALRSLDLWTTGIDVAGLTRSPVLACLTALALREGYAWTRDRTQALAACPALGGLATLNLGSNALDDEDARTLASSPYLGLLRRLKVGFNRISSDGVRAILASPSFGSVVALALGDNPLGDTGAELLANSPRSAGFRELGLHKSGIGDAGARALAESPFLAGLASLDLTHNPIGEEAKRCLEARFGPRVRL